MCIGRLSIGGITSSSLTMFISVEKLKIWLEGMSAKPYDLELMNRMLCESERRMTCEQLKAHPVSPSPPRPQSLVTKEADGSSSTESIGLRSEISTLHSYLTLNPLPILPTSRLMRLIRRTIYLLELRMGMMQRRIWLSWVIRMSFSSLPPLPPHSSSPTKRGRGR